jgi:hypothetical protein
MTASATEEFDVINPPEATLTVAGVTCTVRRVRLRQLMFAIRVLTNGMNESLAQVEFDELGQQEWMALLMAAVPNAIDEFIDLINALVQPPDQISKSELEALRRELENPDPELLVDLVPIIVAQEKDTFSALLGKATALLESNAKLKRVAKKAGLKKK